jgi:hypothetical protein
LAEFRVNLASFASAMNQHGFTGSWYKPATGGQGLELEVYPDLPSIGHGVVFAGWFTYDATAGRRAALVCDARRGQQYQQQQQSYYRDRLRRKFSTRHPR